MTFFSFTIIYHHFFPSTIIIWYPNLVFTGGSVYFGEDKLLIGRAKAASWNGPTIDPRVIQPKSPYINFFFLMNSNIENIYKWKIQAITVCFCIIINDKKWNRFTHFSHSAVCIKILRTGANEKVKSFSGKGLPIIGRELKKLLNKDFD